jgi:predicted lipoprotein with Yx(FWY)xxD motif
MPNRRLLLVVPVLLSLAATACGSSKNTPTAAGAATTTAPTTTAPPASTTTTTAAGTMATVSTGTTSLGTVLVNSAGHTLYHLDRDTATSFACTGGCLSVWPPLTITGGTPVAGAGVTGTLGLRARPGGTEQVTWNGMPLYTFAADSAPGDTKGDGVAGVWHAAKLTATTTGSLSTTTTAGSGGYGSYGY